MSPREIVVLSGKGGTGKTSVTAAFATFAKKTVLADCDVDAANLHLLLTPCVTETGTFTGGHEASIRESDCTSCGLCGKLCRFGSVLEIDGWFGISNCEGCGVCVEFCPAKAIDWNPSITGSWMVSDSIAGTMVHARLRPGAENSGKLASLVRKLARDQAQAQGADVVLIDGPPGIGCPAIASLTGATAALVVTEPTPSGMHDMERILDLAGHFSVPARVLVNKWDLNPELTARIEALAQAKGCSVAQRLPYANEFTHSQMAALPIPLRFPGSELARRLEEIWKETLTWSMS
ncbi:MAG TPA: ATP-binding protein [Fibrobacteria bacterium]|nr:ATP-binding protein [Fibrobacteria bacterium]HOX50134.1 ATP-binding protein [Fibrobacteria bacterium]